MHKSLIMKTLNNQKVQVIQVSFALVDTNESESQEDQKKLMFLNSKTKHY